MAWELPLTQLPEFTKVRFFNKIFWLTWLRLWILSQTETIITEQIHRIKKLFSIKTSLSEKICYFEWNSLSFSESAQFGKIKHNSNYWLRTHYLIQWVSQFYRKIWPKARNTGNPERKKSWNGKNSHTAGNQKLTTRIIKFQIALQLQQPYSQVIFQRYLYQMY